MFDIKNLFSLSANNSAIFVNSLKDKQIVLYGAGSCSYYWYIHILVEIYGLKTKIVLDKKFKKGDFFEGIPASNLDEYIPKKDDFVIISIGNFDIVKKVKKELFKRGFKQIISLHQIYEVHNIFNKPKKANKKKYFLNQAKNIIQAYDLLNDNLSKEIFYNILKTHITKVPQILPTSPRDEQYFPKDLKIDYSIYINCGAYDGENIRALNMKFGKVDEIACFEIDLNSFDKLSKYIRKNMNLIANKVLVLPCAIYDKTITKKAIMGTGLGSRIDKTGKSFVQCVTLDDIMPSIKPTFISMDIEGVELKALKGMKNIVLKNKPSLGICIYHNISHLWKIILFLTRLNIGYKFYIRNYTGFVSESVLYAICEDM